MEWMIHHPTLESVLEIEQEFPGTVIQQEERTYIDVALICSLVDHMIELNIESGENKELMEDHMNTLAVCMRFIPDLLSYSQLSTELEKMTKAN